TILTRFSGLAWCFLVFLRFLRQKATEGVLRGTYNGSYGKWIGFVRSEHRTAQNDKFSPLVRGALTGFPVSKLHISPGQKKTD
ncbi:hypothetical protein ACSLNR_28520, partial [Escherichia coli]